jgi:hypothetical protein
MVVARHVQPIRSCVDRLELSDEVHGLDARGLRGAFPLRQHEIGNTAKVQVKHSR